MTLHPFCQIMEYSLIIHVHLWCTAECIVLVVFTTFAALTLFCFFNKADIQCKTRIKSYIIILPCCIVLCMPTFQLCQASSWA